MKRLALAASVAAVAALTVACGGTTHGDPAPSGGTPHTSTVQHDPTSSAPASLGALKACSLLTQEQASQLGVDTAPKPDKEGTVSSGCVWHTHMHMLDIAIRTNADLSQVQPEDGTLRKTTVSGRKVVVEDASYVCMYAVGVGTHGRVDVSAYKRADSGELVGDCDTAKQAAKLIAPELPKS